MINALNRTIFSLTLVASLVIAGTANSQDDLFLTLSNSRSRALAMGGAFTAVQDDYAALFYNPGSFSLFRDRENFNFTGSLNPILPVTASNQEEYFGYSRETNTKNVFGALQYLVKSLSFSYKMIDFGITLNDEIFLNKNDKRFFSGEGFEGNLFHSAVLCFRLSTQVSIGVSGTYIRSQIDDEVNEGHGFSYGLFLKPNNWYQVGVTYIDYSDGSPHFRKAFERFADESLNVGVAVRPWKDLMFCVDIRNLTENDKPENFGLQEFHLGLEYSPVSHLALRGGYYFEKESGHTIHNYSIGTGLFDFNRFRHIDRKFLHATPVISYTLLFRNAPLVRERWHMLSFDLKF